VNVQFGGFAVQLLTANEFYIKALGLLVREYLPINFKLPFFDNLAAVFDNSKTT
jgi:hypothetical protein